MKKYYIILITFTVLLTTFSCKKYDTNGNEIIYTELYKTNWLVGNWEKIDSIGTLTESWKIENDSTYLGNSFYVINQDTIHSETIELTEDNKHLIYKPTVIGQNNNEPVPFQMIQITDSLIVFANPKHNFPKKIIYQLNKNHTLTTTVSGKIKDRVSTESYNLSKK